METNTMGGTDIVESMVNGIEEMASFLKETHKKTMNVPKELFGSFYQKMKERTDEEKVIAEYKEWIMKTDNLSFDSLKEYQTLTVAEFLKKKILRFTIAPTQREISQVRLDIVREYLPCDYELPSEFAKYCARFRRFISWKDDILLIDYNCYGKYLYQYFYMLSEEERYAMYQLDLLLQMVHKDMAQLHPELAPYLMKNDCDSGSKNYFAVGKNISVMLEGEWFLKFRTDKKYDREWIIKFVSALMKSEYRDVIADEWSKPERRLMLKGAIVGCIKEAGVIEGTDMGIATAIVNGTERENKTFATYMGKGKKCIYMDWILNYIKD